MNARADAGVQPGIRVFFGISAAGGLWYRCMKKLKLGGMVATSVVVLLGALLLAEGQPEGNPAFKPGPAPDWQLKDLQDKPVRWADFKGKVVILDFWATWCPPCRAEIPDFIDLQKQFGSQGLAVVGVAMDQDGPAVVKKFVEKVGINYPVVIGDEAMSKKFGGIEGFPTTFVIDRQGRMVRQFLGLTERGEFEKAIKPLLKR